MLKIVARNFQDTGVAQEFFGNHSVSGEIPKVDPVLLHLGSSFAVTRLLGGILAALPAVSGHCSNSGGLVQPTR